MSENSETKEVQQEELHPIENTIYVFIERIFDIGFAGQRFIPHAANILEDSIDHHSNQIDRAKKLLDGEDDTVEALAMSELIDSTQKLERVLGSELIHILESGFILSAFSSYDALVGDLLTAIYGKKPELFQEIEDEYTVQELLEYETIEDLKEIVLQDRIESFRRKSYIDQFKSLESSFGLKLRDFELWEDFVECSQRRNLFTHCDGKVSQQYLDICNKVGFEFDEKPEIGDKLGVGARYFHDAIITILITGTMLAQTLWRKIFPTEIGLADENLNDVLFEILKRKHWDLALLLGDFALNLPEWSSPLQKRLSIINYGIALKRKDNIDELNEVLGSLDWTDTALDFEMAWAILKEDFEKALILMKSIGKEGKYVIEESYFNWPLFTKFVQVEGFSKTFKGIYGYEFSTDLKNVPDQEEASDVVKEEAQAVEQEYAEELDEEE